MHCNTGYQKLLFTSYRICGYNGSFRNLFGVCHVFFENIPLLDCSEGLAPRAISHLIVNCNNHGRPVTSKTVL